MKRNFWMILAMVLCLLVSCALAEETAAAGAEPASEQDQATLLAGSPENNFQMYSILAQTGDVEAAYQLGKAYYEGVVTEKDLEAAFMWFEAAADGGHMLAREWMAYFLEWGHGTEKDEEKAAELYQALMDEGSS